MKGEDAREREKVICEVGMVTWKSERERRERKGWRREMKREEGKRRTDDKQSISFLPSYSPRQLPQLRVLVRNILLILLSVSIRLLFIVFPSMFLPAASDTHSEVGTLGLERQIRVSKRYKVDIQIITGVADANFPTSSSICMIFLILAYMSVQPSTPSLVS
jgi:hypothetical protein